MKKEFIFLILLLVLSSYSFAQNTSVGSVVGVTSEPSITGFATSFCGNGLIESGEECEGTDLDGKSCESYGFIGGSITCKGCIIDTSNCIAPTVPAGELYNETGPGIKMSPIGVAVIAIIIILIIGGIIYYRYI